jgi:quinoprotein glucose dehydrogenase
VFSPDDRGAPLLLGSDDGVRVWINGELVHTNPAYRAAAPDQDRVSVRLKKGWNKVLLKVLQGAGGWGYYLRFADPGGELRSALKPE